MAISGVSMRNAPVELSSVSVASAKPSAGRACVPPNITSSIFAPRSSLELISPITQRIASEIFDLPLPFGPTIAVISSSKRISVLSAKDLKPCSSSDFRYTIAVSLKTKDFLSYYSINKTPKKQEKFDAFRQRKRACTMLYTRVFFIADPGKDARLHRAPLPAQRVFCCFRCPCRRFYRSGSLPF